MNGDEIATGPVDIDGREPPLQEFEAEGTTATARPPVLELSHSSEGHEEQGRLHGSRVGGGCHYPVQASHLGAGVEQGQTWRRVGRRGRDSGQAGTRPVDAAASRTE
ncbi:hypothetical protein Z517_08154 [Fonsecaea pedrosoi CBS 271.37]|uniref:Uncharacterized protein n=1 Tax=Fonsecaea pedrosoi CBS 271.37 TaxID=1442368 RepID=A0A0D2H0U1_9EURO|nr:uncharacterized protein Z517_08154 [Fonsecaea pedrosoi CBS 271.37]KIW78319.1 hypothetical protein Z517_08154 [Fonsecaea pedrosoi CBS 271.37]